MFEAVMRVAIERYPLILRGPTIKKAQRDTDKSTADSRIPYVMKSGVDALRTYGFADVVEQSDLDVILKEQQNNLRQQKNSRQRRVATVWRIGHWIGHARSGIESTCFSESVKNRSSPFCYSFDFPAAPPDDFCVKRGCWNSGRAEELREPFVT